MVVLACDFVGYALNQNGILWRAAIILILPGLSLTIDETSPQTKPGLIAPLWHTGLLSLFFLAWSTITLFKPDRTAGHHPFPAEYLSLVYLAGLILQWGLFALGYAGLFNRQTALHALIGNRWNNSWDIIRDVLLGLSAVVLALFAAVVLFYALGFRVEHSSILDPKTAVQFYFFFLFLVSGGYAEEVIFRGYFLKQFTSLFQSKAISLLLQAVLFALAHGLGSLSGFCYRLFIGLLMGCIAIKRKACCPASWPIAPSMRLRQLLSFPADFVSIKKGPPKAVLFQQRA